MIKFLCFFVSLFFLPLLIIMIPHLKKLFSNSNVSTNLKSVDSQATLTPEAAKAPVPNKKSLKEYRNNNTTTYAAVHLSTK